MSQLAAENYKGQYCKFVQTAGGSYTLEPVKVPMHVIEEQAARIRKNEIAHHVKKNRMRAQAINGRFVCFLSVVLAAFAIICCVFLGIQNQINTRLNTIASLQRQVESLAEDNDVIEKRLVAAENIKEIEILATEKLGMERADQHQIVFYDSDKSDYMLQYLDVSDIE